MPVARQAVQSGVENAKGEKALCLKFKLIIHNILDMSNLIKKDAYGENMNKLTVYQSVRQ